MPVARKNLNAFSDGIYEVIFSVQRFKVANYIHILGL